MPSLPVCSGREAVRAFERAGWSIRRQTGSHIVLAKPGARPILSVPDHRTLDRGTLRALIRLADLTVDEFLERLD